MERDSVIQTGRVTNDHVKDLENQLEELKSNKQDDEEYIREILKKRDSLNNLIKGIDQTMANIANNDLDKGVGAITQKLDNLKGQKNNLIEQITLQEEELKIANQKITLLESEQDVYLNQKKLLWDKGESPEAFKEVDSLLSGIQVNIRTNKRKVKTIERSIADKQEQISDIDESRQSLSSKVRSNYSAQEIYESFTNEEKKRINAQLEKLNSELEKHNASYASIKSEIDNMQGTISGEKAKQNIAKKTLLKEDRADKNRKMIGLIISAIVLLLVILYAIGKSKTSKKQKS